MKVPFRFFRGELNGYFIRAFLLSRNIATQDLVDELVYHAKLVWKLSGEESAGELPVRESDLVGIAKASGVLRPIQFIQDNSGSIKFTTDHVVNGNQRSERGLWNMVGERFEFVRTANNDYPDDIIAEASSAQRSSLVPKGTVPVGYVPYGVALFDDDGNVITANLLSTPPVDGTPYTPYYGDRFLYLEEVFNTRAAMPIDMFKAYFESIMRIRSNGASIEELLYLTELLCVDYVVDLEIVREVGYDVLYYSFNNSSNIDNKSGRFATWSYICEKRFKYFTLTERV